MKFSREDVLAVAKLARLDIDEAHAESLPAELSKFINYVRILDELDTSNVPPTAQVTVEHAPLRPDVPGPGVEKSVALSAAPRADEIGFLVPGFVDES